MSLRESIEAIRSNLRRGIYQNEAQVSQGIVRRLLAELGWDTFDPELVIPEFAVPGGRVDFALCHPRGRPLIFIEVKQQSTMEGADKQLFRYAFEQGVPIAVLTNGREWHFYLPSGSGSLDDRRFYLLDLLGRDAAESESRLYRYLSFEEARSGGARSSALADYEGRTREAEAERALPRALRALVDDADELFVDLVAEKAAELCGFQPRRESVLAFLRRVASAIDGGVRPAPPMPPLSGNTSQGPAPAPPRGIGFEFEGRWHAHRSGKDVMIAILRLFADRDPTFLQRFVARPHGKKRRWVSQDKAELYPGRSDLQESCSEELRPGWWVGTNYSAEYDMPRIIQAACEVYGIAFGRDLRAFFK